MLSFFHVLLLYHLCHTVLPDQISFLESYGYLGKLEGNAMLSNEELDRAVRKFQRTYGLSITGNLDEATLRAMKEPRCGLPDYNINVKRHKRAAQQHRWETNVLTYSIKSWPRNLHPGYVEHLMRKAFDQWEAVANLTFVRAANPLIEITFGDIVHGCPYNFGTGALAHAFFPGNEPINGDVHFSNEYNWIIDEFSGQTGTSVYAVAVHEIGHALGLEHNTHEPMSIMNPRDMHRKQKITEYDMRLLQSLYGPPAGKVIPTPRPTARPTPRPPTRPTPTINRRREDEKKTGEDREKDGRRFPEETLRPNPCQSTIDAIAEMRGELYLFKDEWFWRVSSSGRLLTQPQLISSFFLGVPYPIDAAVEVGHDMWLFVGDEVYVVHLVGHHIRPKHAPFKLSRIGIPENINKIEMAFIWHYFSPPVTYLWSGDQYWRLNAHKLEVEKTYPRSINKNWNTVPKMSTAAFAANRELHFIEGSKVYRMNSSDHQLKVSKDYPQQLAHFIKDCATTGADSSRHKDSEYLRSVASPFHSGVLLTLLVCSLLY